MLDAVAAAMSTVAYIVGLVLLIGVVSHGVGWLLMRRGTARFVWNYWNGLGTAVLVGGLASLAYAWIVLGLQTKAGSLLAGFGLILLSAGLWMLIPL
jgi:hypothetical protein